MPRASRKLNVRTIPEDGEGPPMVLIEGTKQAMLGLAEFIRDNAERNESCGRWFAPNRPGGKFFTTTATHGIYLHMLPCDHPTVESEAISGRMLKTSE